MKRRPTLTHLLLLLMGALGALLTHSVLALPQPHPQGEGGLDQAQSPYFQVIGAEKGQENFPLKSTAVSAQVVGIIAEVTVTQTYANTGKNPIEAIYIFPASTRAAVHGVEMRLGNRIVRSKVQEKQQAIATYEKAKAENKTASLLQQQRPNVFQMNLANIMPGEEVTVVLRYSERLTAQDRVYEFMYPTVVGPRYTSAGEAAETAVQNPFLQEGVESPATFAMEVQVQTGMPLYALKSTSHEPAIKYTGKDSATVTLPASTSTGNRDFILRYQLADQQVASGLLLHEEKEKDKENFFLLTLQPPARIAADQVLPREYLFILDTSGSMHGFPLDTAKVLMRQLLSSIRETDTFNVMLFSGGTGTMSVTPQAATHANINQALDYVNKTRAGGGTELLPALKKAFETPSESGRSRTIVLVTDGYVNIEKEAFALVKEKLDTANLFTFGIGGSVNRWLIEGLARAGQGDPFIVTNPAEAEVAGKRLKDYISTPVLTDIEVLYEGFTVQDVQPAKLPDVFADRPIQVTGKWTGAPTGRVIIKGKAGGAPYEAAFDVAKEAARGLNHAALRPLWAREKVQTLTDLEPLGTDPERKREITTLGITYELLTEYTAFVGVDEVIRHPLADSNTVVQPTALPQGVSNAAVGGAAPTPMTKTSAVPEPGTTSLLLLTALVLMFYRHRRMSARVSAA